MTCIKMGVRKSEGRRTRPLQTDERLGGASALHGVPLSHCYLDIVHLCRAKSQQVQDGVLVVCQNDVSLATVANDTQRQAFNSCKLNVDMSCSGRSPCHTVQQSSDRQPHRNQTGCQQSCRSQAASPGSAAAFSGACDTTDKISFHHKLFLNVIFRFYRTNTATENNVILLSLQNQRASYFWAIRSLWSEFLSQTRP